MKAKKKAGRAPRKSSRSGTRPPGARKDSAFTKEELCGIIELCVSRRVSELRVGGLHLKFGEGIPRKESILATVTDSRPPVDLKKEAEDALAQDEIRVKSERLAMSLIENPEEFERMIADEDLVEEQSEDDEDES